jgi:hypothetical protein
MLPEKRSLEILAEIRVHLAMLDELRVELADHGIIFNVVPREDGGMAAIMRIAGAVRELDSARGRR